MKKILTILFTVALFINCSDDDSNSNELDDDQLINEEVLEDELIDQEPNEEIFEDELIEEEELVEQLPFIGRWTLTSVDPEPIQGPECEELEFISFDENGSFLERKVSTSGFSSVINDEIVTNLICRLRANNEGIYEYNEINNEIIFTNNEGEIDIAEVTQEEDELILSYNDGGPVIIYARESEDNVILDTNPLMARWFLFSTAESIDGTFVEIDCSRAPLMIFGIRNNYVFRLQDFEFSDDICNVETILGEFTNDETTITINITTDGVEESRDIPYTIEGEFLTIDRFGDGTYIERFIRED